MSSEPTTLFSLARSKLHLSVCGSKDSCSLHRWVLLKNSIIQSVPSLATPQDEPNVNSRETASVFEEDQEEEEEVDSFMFPDAGAFVDDPETGVKSSEAQWLDSLLENLDDEDDDFGMYSEVQNHLDDDDFSPLPSPMSSSDDLTIQAYYVPPIYPPVHSVPYSFHPPLIQSSYFDPPYALPFYDGPLPYHDMDDNESIPDAVEDTSDDESDAPATPSIDNSRSSLVDPASIPLPGDHSDLRHISDPHVFVDSEEDAFFYPFNASPLPFPHSDRHHSYNTCQEC